VAIAAHDARALEQLMSALIAGQGMAFIVVLDAEAAERVNTARLRPPSPFRVVMIDQRAPLEPDCIFVAQPGQLISCEEGELRATKSETGLPIDHLLRSLAANQAGNAAAVLLSGVRGDGAVGAVEMRAAGALVLLQAPSSAGEASVPEIQLLAATADRVLPVAGIQGALVDYFRSAAVAETGPLALALEREPEPEPLGLILDALAQTVGHDFSRYKRSMIGRRVLRRMTIHGLRDPRQYLVLLESSTAEAELLFNEMLIGVTSFFRDPAAYAALRAALELYLQRPQSRRDLRVWVAGCSTGEEAYSIAIVIQECLERAGINPALKILATDLDPKAIEFARSGRYPIGISAYVSPERLARYFVMEDGGYRINKETRDRIVFAPHNIGRDPPFTNIDILSCRNLLIYLEPDLQEQVLSLFDYALVPGGLLLLGGFESVGGLNTAFEPIDKEARLFAHCATHTRKTWSLPIDPLWTERPLRREDRLVNRAAQKHSAATIAEELLIEEFVPPSAIVSPMGEIVYVHGRTGRFLEPAIGAPSVNIFDMAREGLRLELPAAVRAAQQGESVVRRGLNVRTNGHYESVTLRVKPLTEPESVRGLLLVSFELDDARSGPRLGNGDATSQLEAELQHAQSALQGSIEDLESSNEELKSMNEELQSTNEEVQSANEELSTSREELQSLNEELQTLNDELAQRNRLLSQSNDDMHNLLSSLQVTTVFVDAQLNVKRFTLPARKLFKLRDSDIGRPVSDLAINLDYPNLVDDAEEVLRTLVFTEREAQTSDGEWRMVRITPYRTANNVIDGLTITVTDIQRIKELERERETLQDLFDGVVGDTPKPFVVLDAELRITTASLEFARRFCATGAHLVGEPLGALGVGWRQPPIAERLGALARGEACPPFRLQGSFGASLPVDVIVHPRRLQETNRATRYLLLFEDVAAPPPAATLH